MALTSVFSTFAYMMVDRLRAEALQGAGLARATVGTIRLRHEPG